MSGRIGAFIVLVVVFGIGAFAFFSTNKLETKESINTETKVTSTNNSTYTTNVSYQVPESTETLGLTISVLNGTVTDVNVSLSKNKGKSINYQNNFEKSYKQFVVGKQLKDINLSRVGGASVTTKAFMDAIKAVQKQAL